MKASRILLICVFALPFVAYSQNDGGGGGDGGGETKIWEPDLVELWIYWHKQQYRMLQSFYHNEDTLRNKQNEDYQNWMRKLREMDEILFKQHQDNDIPKPTFLLPEAAYAIKLSQELGTIIVNTGEILNKAPVDPNLQALYIDASVKTYFRFGKLIEDTQKYLTGWDRQNIRDNDFRDNLSDYILKELNSMIGNWNQLNRRTSVAKYAKILNQN
jgi:hypothetical protein